MNCVVPGCTEPVRYVTLPGGSLPPGEGYCMTDGNNLLRDHTNVLLETYTEAPTCDFCAGAPPAWMLRTLGTTFSDMLVEYDDDHTATQLSNMGNEWATCDECKPFIDALLEGVTDERLGAFMDHVAARGPLATMTVDADLRSVVIDLWRTVFSTAVSPLTKQPA